MYLKSHNLMSHTPHCSKKVHRVDRPKPVQMLTTISFATIFVHHWFVRSSASSPKRRMGKLSVSYIANKNGNQTWQWEIPKKKKNRRFRWVLVAEPCPTWYHMVPHGLQVIITKLDGHAKGGGALSAVSATWGLQVAGDFIVDFDGFPP